MLLSELNQINESVQFTPEEQKRAMARLQPLVDANGEIDLEKFFNKEMELSAGGMDIPLTAYSVKRVNLSQLYPTQDVIEIKWVQAVLNNQGRTQGLAFVAIADQMTIVDGHHRIVAEIAAGRQTVEVNLTKITSDDDGEMVFIPG